MGETEFVNGVATMAASGSYGETRACAAIIGHADPRLGDGVKEVLHAHLAAGGGRRSSGGGRGPSRGWPGAPTCTSSAAASGRASTASGRGALTPSRVISSIPGTSMGANTAAGIETDPAGRFVCVSNRGHDGIDTFGVDAASGRLTPVGWPPSEGKGPRFFAPDPPGTRLYAANENGDTIAPFGVDAGTGRLSRAGEVIRTGGPTGSPACIVFSTI